MYFLSIVRSKITILLLISLSFYCHTYYTDFIENFLGNIFLLYKTDLCHMLIIYFLNWFYDNKYCIQVLNSQKIYTFKSKINKKKK